MPTGSKSNSLIYYNLNRVCVLIEGAVFQTSSTRWVDTPLPARKTT
jgi:hypothetical protein